MNEWNEQQEYKQEDDDDGKRMVTQTLNSISPPLLIHCIFVVIVVAFVKVL